MYRRRPVRRSLALLAAALGASALVSLTEAGPAAASGAVQPATGANPVMLCPRVPHRMSCLAEQVPGKTVTGSTPAVGVNGYSPADLRLAYQVPASSSTETVAVVDAYDAATVEADMATYRTYFGLPECTSADGCFTTVNQYGDPDPANLPPPPPTDSHWQVETALDVEMVSAICPTCHILLVEANDDDRSMQLNLESAVRTAATMGARYISMSWGGSEFSDEQSVDSQFMNAPGVAYVAAAGDTDYGTSWPAANPNVVSVGGTSLVRAGNARGWSESVWGYTNGEGTGSGCSSYEPMPMWQNSPPVNMICLRRAMNDVSIVGDPHTGVASYQGGQWNVLGGTSAGAPMIAAMYAMAGAANSGIPAPAYPYGHPAAFNDVTTNANAFCGNALCTAEPGWDGPSGVGTPIGLTGFSPVQPNLITVHNPGTVAGYPWKAVRVDNRASDSGGMGLTYTAWGLPVGTAIGGDGVIYGAPQRSGTYWVTVSARDGTGAVGSTSFRWDVLLHQITTSYTPRISGTLSRGHLVWANWGAFRQDSPWGPVIRPYAHIQWYIDGHAISGANHTWFTIPWNYRGHRIQFWVRAWASGYATYGWTVPLSARIT